MDLYHVCSNNSSRAKNGPDPGVNFLHRLIKVNVKNLQVSDSGPLWPSCSYFSTKTTVVGTQKNCLNETVLLSTQNKC